MPLHRHEILLASWDMITSIYALYFDYFARNHYTMSIIIMVYTKSVLALLLAAELNKKTNSESITLKPPTGDSITIAKQ